VELPPFHIPLELPALSLQAFARRSCCLEPLLKDHHVCTLLLVMLLLLQQLRNGMHRGKVIAQQVGMLLRAEHKSACGLC
jgi:hypothetical protein